MTLNQIKNYKLYITFKLLIIISSSMTFTCFIAIKTLVNVTSALVVKMISLVILLVILAPSLSAQNKSLECKTTWMNKQAYYKFLGESDSKPKRKPFSNPLSNENLFNNKDYELCRKLNNSLYFGYDLMEDEIESDYAEFGYPTFEPPTYVFPVSFNDIETGHYNTTDLVTKRFSFFYTGLPQYRRKEPIINITTKIPKDSCISELTEGGKIEQIFPIRYKISRFTPDKIDRFYHLIEGERCKGVYNEKTQTLENKVCWNHPYFCRGPRFECIINDDIDTFCYNSGTGEGQKKIISNEIPYSVYIGELIYWRFPLLVYSVRRSNIEGLWTFTWNCTDLGIDVLCDYVDDGPRPGLTFLKTLSGYAG